MVYNTDQRYEQLKKKLKKLMNGSQCHVSPDHHSNAISLQCDQIWRNFATLANFSESLAIFEG